MTGKYANEQGIEINGYLLNAKLLGAAAFDKRLQNMTCRILCIINSFAYSDGLIKHFSIKKTAEYLGISRWSIQNHIKKLIELNYLTKQCEGKQGYVNQYRLCMDNFSWYWGVTQLDCSPHVTQLDNTPVTPIDYMDVTQLDNTKKTIENIEIKKEKRAHTLDDFLLLVEEGVEKGLFGDLRALGLDEIKKQAIACWDHWDASAKFPDGNMVAALRKWIRSGIQREFIKIKSPSNEQSANNVRKTNLEGLAEWKIALHSKLGKAVFNSWIANLELDEQGDLVAPNAHIANWVMDKYMKEIIAVLPNVSHIYAAKDAASVN